MKFSVVIFDQSSGDSNLLYMYKGFKRNPDT
jgi:hypothetical protein